MLIDKYTQKKLDMVYAEYDSTNAEGEGITVTRIFVENLEKGIKYIKDNNIKNISIDTSLDDFKKQTLDLSFLSEFKDIDSLTFAINLSKKTDISPIYNFTNLKMLRGVCDFEIDFSFLPHLRELYMTNLFENTKNYEKLTELTHLYIGPKTKDLKQLDKLKALEYIRILGSNLENLDGLKDLPNLRKIEIRNASKLQNIDELVLNDNVEDVLLENIKRLTDYSIFEKNTGIKYLCFWTTVDSLDFVPKMKSLESITFRNVKDGNLNPLLKSNTLKWVYFSKNKRHFTHTLDEITIKLN
jgi:hypothetical protein